MLKISEFYNKHIHFIGIGGISMSSLAQHLLSKGCFISGSDICESEETLKLKKLGIKVFLNHDQANIIGSNLVVYNSAIKNNNTEFLYAKSKNIPVISRIDLLNAISQEFRLKVGIAGCHGKTTTTALISNILKQQNAKT